MKTKRDLRRLKWITKRLIFTACILFLGGAALAQDEESERTEKPQVLETMEVWGTQISSSSVSLGEDQISVKQADHLSDLLRRRYIPFAVKNRASCGYAHLSVRCPLIHGNRFFFS